MDKSKAFAAAEKAILKGQNDKAIQAFEKILQADPKDVKALNKAADLYVKKGDTSKAIDYLKRVGAIYTQDGFYSKAIAIYKRILKIDQNSSRSELVSTHDSLAQLYAQLGLVSDAMAHFKIVVDFYDEANDKEALLDALKRVSDLDPGNIDSQLKLIELLISEDQKGEALSNLERLAENTESRGHLPDIIRVYESWYDWFPNSLEVLQKLVNFYIKGREPKKALAKLQAAFQKDPYNASILELLSSAFVTLSQPDKAKAVDYELIKLYRQANEPKKLEEVEKRLKDKGMSPASGGAASEIKGTDSTVTVKREMGEDTIDPAESLIQNMELDPEEKKIISECEVYLKYGLVDKSREVLSSQLSHFPQSLVIRWKLKNVYNELGRKEEAVQALSEILLLAKERSLSSWIQIAEEELRSLDPQHPSLEQSSSSQKSESLPSDEQQGSSLEDGTQGEVEATFGIDESDVSIVVDDEILEEVSQTEQASRQEPSVERKEESESSNHSAAASEEKTSGEINASEILEESSEESGIDVLEGEAEAENQENAFLLSEDDFTSDELSQLQSQLAPEDKSTQSSPSAEESGFDDDTAAQDEISDSLEEQSEVPLELVEEVDDQVAEQSEAPEIAQGSGLELDSESAEVVEDADFEIRQSLEEVEFFRSQGFSEEAEQILQNLKDKYPDHPRWQQLSEHQEESVEKSKEDLSSNVVELETLGAKLQMKVQEDQRTGDEDFFDLAGELSNELEEQPDQSSGPSEIQDIFNAFKKGVSETISEEDSETHFDLGVAYREMGLTDDAIEEFRLVSKVPGKKASALYQIGLCELARENYEKAKESFDEALEDPQLQEQEKLSISYDLAEVFLQMEDHDRAKQLLEEVRRLDPEFREVQDKLKQFG